MPSHIDVLVGNYEAAVVSNAAAIVADLKAIELGGIHVNGMTVGFTAHNHHMLALHQVHQYHHRQAHQYHNRQLQLANFLQFNSNLLMQWVGRHLV